MRIIKINSFCYIKYMYGMYMLIDRQTLRVVARAFDLDQLASELIRHYNNYLSYSDEMELIDLIQSIKDLQKQLLNMKVETG